ncbi:HD domain-containing protein [Candidatus Roizmanbacteria bacterium]|nr:HD domain-containing protein [Candidatus Roizmanbacteria bacterium]
MSNKKDRINDLLTFINRGEKLKQIMRHSWLSNGRRESVAEHTWRMALMAIVLASELDKKVNLAHTLEIILVHDLPEIIAGDRAAWKARKADKHRLEKEGLQVLTKTLSPPTGKKIMSLWLEFEEDRSLEAHFAQALDKLEVLIQHNQANIKTWRKSEREFSLHYGDETCTYDKTLKSLKDLVRINTAEKIR